MIPDPRAITAARNNADWHEAVFEAQGLAYRRTAAAFVADDPPPPYHAHVSTTAPDAEAVLADLSYVSQRHPDGFSLKDSFSVIDTAGFSVLFHAEWIWRHGPHPSMPKGWTVVTDPDELQHWENAWVGTGAAPGTRMFPPPFLAREDVVFLAQKVGHRFIAGCIANRSTNCVGLSNAFAATPSATAYAMAADAAASIWGGLPVVGYETGPPLDHARAAGFHTVGDLRVLVSNQASG